MDYTDLTKSKIKDKSPVPIIEELSDELAGSIIHSKVYLRSGYYQITTSADDIHKIAFKTHSGVLNS